MAPRWLSTRQSAWGTPGRGGQGIPVRTAALIGVAILIVGSLGGFAVRSVTQKKSTAEVVARSTVVDPTVNGLADAGRSDAGAIRGLAAMIAGLPSLSLESSGAQSDALTASLATTADPSLRQDLQDQLDGMRTTLIGTPAVPRNLTAQLTTTPVTYRLDRTDDTHVRVQIWYVTVVVDGGVTPQINDARWSTVDAQMAWTDHWRILTFQTKDGPTPTTMNESGQNSTFGEIAGVFSGFTAFRYAVGG
jgi:hypothetical protein